MQKNAEKTADDFSILFHELRIFLPSIYSVQIDILQKKKNKTLTLNLFVTTFCMRIHAKYWCNQINRGCKFNVLRKKKDLFGTFSRISIVSLSSRR